MSTSLLPRPGKVADRPDNAPERIAPRSDRLGRIFNLPPFAEPTPAVKAALLDIGRPGGILDAGDDLTASPTALISNPALSQKHPDHPRLPAGIAFFSQFLDHDSPAFDLDTIYGLGPIAARHLYDQQDRGKLRLENGGRFEDVPRNPDRTANLGDPRNDENLVLSGLHAAFLFAHNRALDMVRAERGRTREGLEPFELARCLLRWHYQWLIVHEFLPLVIGQSLVDHLLKGGPRFYRGGFLPVEFQGAAYRFRHSLVRPAYRANSAFAGLIADPAQPGGADPPDLVGGARAPRRFVGWQSFFDFGDGQVQASKRIDTHLSTPLFHLPGLNASLPQRTLLKQLTWGLPSGQAIARTLRAPALSAADLDELRRYELGLEHDTPLFYYVLKEAEVMQDGLRLGPVGGRIVGEVMLGLLQQNRGSYLAMRPGWRPTLPSRSGRGEFRLVDLLTFAGVDPASRGPFLRAEPMR